MRNATIIGLVVFVGCVFAFSQGVLADSTYEEYEKYMGKYHDHMKEAREEAAEGDWDDYYEELGKAERDYAKAQSYLQLAHGRGHGYGGGYYSYPGPWSSPHQYYGGLWQRPYQSYGSRKHDRDFNFGFGFSHGRHDGRGGGYYYRRPYGCGPRGGILDFLFRR